MKTVRVRIAVAVDQQGYWCAAGGGEVDAPFEFSRARDRACSKVDPGASVFWITAELPIPEPIELPGSVEPATKDPTPRKEELP